VPWAVLRTTRIRGGQVRWLSFAPDRHRVYLAVPCTLAGCDSSLQERTLPGWRLLHTAAIPGSLAAGPVAAAGSAVWASAGAGTTGEVRLLTAGLRQVRLVLGAGQLARSQEEKHFFLFENGAQAAVIGAVTC
jgi:hypothetical protein